MKDGYGTQLTRQIGEHLVVAKLGRLGIFATPFAGNVPDYDLLASDASGHCLPLQVKAIIGPSWQFSAAAFLDIEFQVEDQGVRQVVRGKRKLHNPKLICVFVNLKPEGNDEFFILTLRALQQHVLDGYSAMLEKRGGFRPNNRGQPTTPYGPRN